MFWEHSDGKDLVNHLTINDYPLACTDYFSVAVRCFLTHSYCTTQVGELQLTSCELVAAA